VVERALISVVDRLDIVVVVKPAIWPGVIELTGDTI
jgi:hypothetical protein